MMLIFFYDSNILCVYFMKFVLLCVIGMNVLYVFLFDIGWFFDFFV